MDTESLHQHTQPRNGADLAIREFERALRASHDDVWWREFIALVKDRRQGFMEQLATQRQDQRTEDTIRGQISELTFIIALDQAGAKEPQHGRRAEKPADRPTDF